MTYIYIVAIGTIVLWIVILVFVLWFTYDSMKDIFNDKNHKR